MFAAVRFVWNATAGHRLRPWRSEYLKWRIETYSGKKADELETREVLAKHDENYMPKDVADALKKQGHWKDEYAKQTPAAPNAQGASR